MQNVEVIHRHTHMQEKKLVDREQEVIFTNWTDRDFEHTWNKRLYRFKANKSYYLPFYLAEHFARHLATRELNKMAQDQHDPKLDAKTREANEQRIIANLELRQQFMDKCVEVTEPTDVGIVTPKEVPVREVKLKTQERSDRYVADGRATPADVAQRAPIKEPVAPGESSFEGVGTGSPG